MLEPILATSIRSIDLTTIPGNQDEFYLVIDSNNNKRKIARVTNSEFDAYEISANSNNRDRSTITGNNNGAFITHAGECLNKRLIYLQYNNLGEINKCFKSSQSRCSDNGRENIVFLNNSTRAIWSLINQDDAYLYYLNAPSLPSAKSEINKKVVTNERNWNLFNPSLICSDSNLIQNNIPINLIDKITDLQLTLDTSISPNELAVSFSRRSNLYCNLEGYLYTVNPDFTISRIKDSTNQPVNLPTIACSDLGFDRVVFDNDFILLRYQSTKIDLHNVFPNIPSL